MLFTTLIFIFILGLLIFVHEFGHFIVAKRAGMKVEEFGFGFPPRMIGKKIGETIYSLNWLPLGGFVRILGEDGEKREDPRSFGAKPFWIRFVALFAGVSMNFLLGAYLFMIGYTAGLPTAVTTQDLQEGRFKNVRDLKIQILAVSPNSPAEEAGLVMGDIIRSISFSEEEDGLTKTFPVSYPDRVKELIDLRRGKEMTLQIQRGGNIFNVNVIPREEPPEGEGALGISMSQTVTVFYSWYESIWRGLESAVRITWTIAVLFFNILKDLIFTGRFAGEVTGPVGIAILTFQFTQLGIIYLLQFTALISINLAILNVLPFPALDGGRILFLIIEKIKGSPVSPRVERAVHTAGLIFLILLMVLITYRDILRFI